MNNRFLIDAAERIAATFVVAFLAAWLAEPGFDLNTAEAAALAGIVAAGTAVKTLLARFVGSHNTAALLPRSEDTPLPAPEPRHPMLDALDDPEATDH